MRIPCRGPSGVVDRGGDSTGQAEFDVQIDVGVGRLSYGAEVPRGRHLGS